MKFLGKEEQKHKRISQNKVKSYIKKYIIDNAKEYIIVTILFLIGIIISVIVINSLKETDLNSSKNFIENYIATIKENYQIDMGNLLKDSILRNVYTTLILWILGCTVIGMPLIYITILYKGYTIGFSIASIITTLGVR